VDKARRHQLRNHHTATHIIFASCRKVLGPHVWQHGAKKTVEQAHLDITHYTSLTKEEEMQIENTANQIVLSEKKLIKGWMGKGEAEKEYGFRLYQGGVVPGNTLRVVRIEDTDVEACCGTHCENTGQVGWIKLMKTSRISDGILRLYFVAGAKVIEKQNEQVNIINEITQLWNISQNQLVETADRFFQGFKKLGNEVDRATQKILGLTVRCILSEQAPRVLLRSKEENARIYFSFMGRYAEDLKVGPSLVPHAYLPPRKPRRA